jgi:two-component system chemotaxis response regulator CheY
MSDQLNIRVLLADDEAHVRQFVRAVVTSMGCEVVGEAADGRQAIELFDRTAPDLVLLDINMPVLDGLAALKEIRGRSGTVAIVMLTSLASPEVVEQSFDAGATYHLRKDVPIAELREEIRDVWQAHLDDLKGAAG